MSIENDIKTTECKKSNFDRTLVYLVKITLAGMFGYWVYLTGGLCGIGWFALLLTLLILRKYY